LDAGGLQGFNYVSRAASGGDDVFYYYGGFTGMDCEASAQYHFGGGGVAFGEEKTGSESAGDFVADNQAANSGRDHDVNLCEVRGQLAAEFLGDGRMLEDERALHVFVGMKTAG
jgi:hypothetical protein